MKMRNIIPAILLTMVASNIWAGISISNTPTSGSSAVGLTPTPFYISKMDKIFAVSR